MGYLNAKGKIEYDYKKDILFLYIVNPQKEYEKSYDADGLIIDLSKDNFLTGFEILDASEKLNVDRLTLKSIKHGQFKCRIEKERIILALYFAYQYRNKERIATLNMEKVNKEALKESELCVSA